MSQKSFELKQGFTAVELLVAIIIAVMLLAGGYQLYTTAQRSAFMASNRAKASNVAYDLMRSYQQNSSYIQSPCVAQTIAAPASNVAVPASYSFPTSTYSAAITCPYGSTSTSLVTVTVNYTNPETYSVTRSIMVSP